VLRARAGGGGRRGAKKSPMDFQTAVTRSKDCKSPTNEDKLSLYKYYKQVRAVLQAGAGFCLVLALALASLLTH